VKLAREAIAGLVPHAGAMCLLDEVAEWNEGAIVCHARSHRDAANPLRSAGRLAAIMGVEYAAQAVAVHGGLTGNVPRTGYLAALRDVECSVERLDTIAEDLTIHATQVAAESGRLLYDFRIEAGGRELLRGRLTVVHK
jgi:predicted hotdog family 3-hydroxylacyl-ACP dehydratase